MSCSKLKLEWYNVTVIKNVTGGSLCKRTRTKKVILDGVSGIAEPGEILTVMGPSGGGKTSLLNVLSRRLRLTEGKILLNGQKLPKFDPLVPFTCLDNLPFFDSFLCSLSRNFNKLSAYVMQDDKLFAVLTPRELFQFSANLRLPRSTTAVQKKHMVEMVIRKLKMEGAANTHVGDGLMRGLSGGERKRTSIGYELITNPSLLFLDEPTSGLDSFTALNLVTILKELASEGHTILCTIHQPSSDIFRLFDKLILLVQGRLAYTGPAQQAISFFADLAFQCPTYTNPGDFFLKVLQNESLKKDSEIRLAPFYEAAKKLTPRIVRISLSFFFSSHLSQ